MPPGLDDLLNPIGLPGMDRKSATLFHLFHLKYQLCLMLFRSYGIPDYLKRKVPAVHVVKSISV